MENIDEVIESLNKKYPRAKLEDFIPVVGVWNTIPRMVDRAESLHSFVFNKEYVTGDIACRKALKSSTLDIAYLIGLGLANIGYATGIYLLIKNL